MRSTIRLPVYNVVTKLELLVAKLDGRSPRGSRVAQRPMLVLHVLRIELDKSYHGMIELLSEMYSILEEIGLTRLPRYIVIAHSLVGFR